MMIQDSVLRNSEKIMFALRQLYISSGYRSFRMSKFEEYDLYAGNKDFLLSDNVITFTDTDGKLLALKPDVTLSIIKNAIDEPEALQKVFYNENVYRVSKGTGTFKEIMQSGVECFGAVDQDTISDTLLLAGKSLALLDKEAVLAISNLDILEELIGKLKLRSRIRRQLLTAIGEKNLPAMEALTADCQDAQSAELLRRLVALHGSAGEVLPQLDELLGGVEAYAPFRRVLAQLEGTELLPMLTIDFSVTEDMHYYNGIIFKGFLRDVPVDVLTGGQYDKLMQRLGRKSRAIGFAVYTDQLDRLDLSGSTGSFDGYLNIALPKGRLGEKVYDMFARAGFECPAILEPNRKLIFENPAKKVRYFWVKPSDVAIYVERGAADIGVAGKDILLEYSPEVYELLDLKKGKCRMAVAAPKGYRDDGQNALRVATKFANIAKRYYRTQGRDIDIIHLNGSIEIAPILGLSDVIVDIVETGTTLRENDLEVVTEILPISARLIANKASYQFKMEQIRAVAQGLRTITEADA